MGPATGMRFNCNKSLVDPYAKAISGDVDWKEPIFPYDVASGDPLKKDEQDSARGVPKSVVIHDPFDWRMIVQPEIPLPDSVIYETHVKGFSYQQSRCAGETARHLCRAGARRASSISRTWALPPSS